MSVKSQRDEAIAQIRRELRRLINDSGVTQRSIEEKNGFTQGYLSQVLKGHIALGARHILGVLFALGIPPQEFFARLFGGYEEPDSQVPLDEIRERLARYDAAIDQLEEQGLVSPVNPSSPPADDPSES
ncbi:MAG: helix-turn-helix transcriptional regulator [bacterium]|nr:helix-turn-helix transcriptional regulator [bacterium]